MALSLHTEVDQPVPHLPIPSHSDPSQKQRIMAALGSVNQIPRVDDESISRYYQYLSENLAFPFFGHFPEPTSSQEEAEFSCVVLELLDPMMHLGDEFDGIFCKTRKGQYEVNLPLIELYLPENSRNAELIEDYWYWFWNWR